MFFFGNNFDVLIGFLGVMWFIMVDDFLGWKFFFDGFGGGLFFGLFL